MRHGLRNEENRPRARAFRRNAGASEDRLWQLLRNRELGFKFRRQVPVGDYILDFYCAEVRLCIEVDGEHHADRALQDGMRDDWLRGQGIDTIRIPSQDLFDEKGSGLTYWTDVIRAECLRRRG